MPGTTRPAPSSRPELVKKLQNSSLFNQGFETVEYLAASILDMKWHEITEPQPGLDVNKFETQAMAGIGLIPEITPRYRSTYFNHIFNGGYSAGYYVYIWAEQLDADAFEAFKEKGLFDKATALVIPEERARKIRRPRPHDPVRGLPRRRAEDRAAAETPRPS